MSATPGRGTLAARRFRLRALAFERPTLDSLTVAAVALGSTLLMAYVLSRGSLAAAAMLAAAPLAGLGAAAFLGSDRSALAFAGFALTLTVPAVNGPLPYTGSVSIFAADLVVLAGVGAWLPSRLTSGARLTRPRAYRTPVLGAAFGLFALATVWAVIRGNEAYGVSLVGQPIRLAVYAAVAAVIVDLDPAKAWKGLTAVFYTGAVWEAMNGIYYIASGSSQTDAFSLSTGGTRFLALDVSLYVAAALFLALLNLEFDASRRRRALHLFVLLVASFDVVIAFGRGTYVSVALVSFVLILAYRQIRMTLLRSIPVLAPLLIIAIIFVPQQVRDVAPTFIDRVNPTLQTDAAVQWREKANEAILNQFQESPVIGVGFGRGATFTLDGQEWVIDQDPHNSFVFLLAAGGLVLLGSFVLLLLVFAYDTWRRFRSAVRPEERLLVLWSLVTLFAFLANAVAEPLFTYPSVLLTMWMLLLLPSVVPLRDRSSSPE